MKIKLQLITPMKKMFNLQCCFKTNKPITLIKYLKTNSNQHTEIVRDTHTQKGSLPHQIRTPVRSCGKDKMADIEYQLIWRKGWRVPREKKKVRKDHKIRPEI